MPVNAGVNWIRYDVLDPLRCNVAVDWDPADAGFFFMSGSNRPP
jgi:hypothetical protein